MKLFVPVFIVIILISSCKKDVSCNYKDSSVIAPATEIKQLQDSLAKYRITATQAPSGFFFKINSSGNDPFVSNLCSNIALTYKGQFFDGKIFDSTATGSLANFQLGQVIVGWQKGVPLIKKGGDIDLYIPPSLGFGATARPGLPANSYLVFNVHIVDIQ
ncbi:MAG: FKBP-type peptidyl-prolyl cis-trans isomerase [Bacteroidota bacterium]|nr:FKBP-type peptidyl-prolyl cis-trans isomerase [Bacteroidota bacterium]